MTPENKHWIQDNTLMLITVFFCVLHRTDADPSLDENQCFQSRRNDGDLRPGTRFCR